MKSFSRAAEVLHIAQPALSTTIRKLEDELGVQLVVRNWRGVEPTEAGSVLFDRASDILRLMDETKMILSDLSRDKVRIGLPPSANVAVVRDLMDACHDRLPRVTVNVTEAPSHVLLEWTADDRLDLCLAYHLEAQEPHLDTMPIGYEDLYLIRAEGAAPLPPEISFVELQHHPLILPNPHKAVRRLFDDVARHLGIKLDMRLEIDSVNTMVELVHHGVGGAILPVGRVGRGVADGRLLASRIVSPSFTRTMSIVHSTARRPLSQSGAAVRDLLADLASRASTAQRQGWYAKESAP